MSESTRTGPLPSDPDQRHRFELKVEAIEKAKEDHESVILSGPSRLGLLAAVVLLATGWHRTLIEMWLRWYPAWDTPGLTLMDRLTQGDSYYTHGPLVALTSLMIALYIHKRVGFPRVRSRGATLLGGFMLVVSLALHLLSVSPSARVMFVSGFALVGVVGGMVLMSGGWPLARAYWLPVAFLLFMVPLPEVAVGDLNFRLKLIAGRAAMWLTNHMFGVPAVLDGSYIYLPSDPTGSPKFLVMENVCSGLRSLISLVWFASLFAMVCRVKGLWRLWMLVMALPVAVACNVVRITGLNLAAHYISIDVAGPGGWFHDLSGLLVFAVALGVLFGLEQAVIVLNRWLKRDWVDQRLLGFLETLPRHRIARHPNPQLAPLGLLALTAAMSVYWSASAYSSQASQFNTNVVPKDITLQGTTFIGQDHDLDQQSLMILEYPDYLLRRYANPESGRHVDLLIVFSANNRKGTHPPEVCIEGGGNILTQKKILSVNITGAGRLRLRELLTQRSGLMTCFLYTYKCGNRYTPSFFGQQFWIFLNGLTGRDTAGALVRLSVPAGTHDIEPSRQLALATAEVLLPHIHRGLR